MTDIIGDPFNRNCVIIAIGLNHLGLSNGKLLRACGTALSPEYDTPIASSFVLDLFGGSDAFFDLVREKDGYWAVSNLAVYHFGTVGGPKRYELKSYTPWHGLWVSRDVPNVLVLGTSENGRFSANSGTPLVVPLN